MKEGIQEQVANQGVNGWLIALFVFFGVIFVANGIFIYLGVSTWNGVATPDHYRQGLKFNQVISAQEEQEKLGWQGGLNKETTPQGLKLTFALQDRQGKPVTGLQGKGTLYRPVKEGYDLPLVLREEAPGIYQQIIQPPLPGWWEVRLVMQGQNSEFLYVTRIQVDKPS
ncbi:MAG: FixH family protein [Magnetococcales bacterium]|nr:FixH family protein [Magnetococcales bacterium]NGZ26683.1 FixH family protein [Magnetococcales bacterium]